MKYLVLGLLIVLAFVAVDGYKINTSQSTSLLACGSTCADNNGCNASPNCSRCIDYQCRQGLTCGSGGCLTNTDCDQAGSCKLCTKGFCKAEGRCLDYCDGPADCVATCTSCIEHKCVSGCGRYCADSSVCHFNGSTCNQCIDERCQYGGCGTQCISSKDCMGQGNCTACLNQRCTSVCGGNCSFDFDCQGHITGCGSCISGKCTSGVCGAQCPIGNNNACRGTGSDCSICNAQGRCARGAACKAVCVVDSDCDQGADSVCKFCHNKICDRI